MHDISKQPSSPKKHDRRQRRVNLNASRFADDHLPNAPRELSTRRGSRQGQLDSEDPDTDGSMDERRPPFHRHNDGKSEEALLHTRSKESYRATRRASANASPSRRPSFSADSLDLDSRFSSRDHDRDTDRRPSYFSGTSTMRSHSPGRVERAMKETRKTYKWAAFFLVLSLVSFVVQTETAVYIQHELGWSKAYAMLCVFLKGS